MVTQDYDHERAEVRTRLEAGIAPFSAESGYQVPGIAITAVAA